ncbi:IFT27 [Bugula neritina]|uniref:IFT27 n=1 Tax=Bugula neritina TaxID=10212 RepID=A0A7J7KT56_BUGNE|nr:IFT27 [Bugula neritina]
MSTVIKAKLVVIGVLVANKVDLDERRIISPKAGEKLAEHHGLKYFEVSAKDQKNVEVPFYYLANEFYKLYHERIETTRSMTV